MIKVIEFTDSEAWQQAHILRIAVLKLSMTFPIDYRFGLAAQLQRSSISIGSNLAEGFGRRGIREKIQFYNIARGSLIEVQDQLLVSRDMSLIPEDDFKVMHNQSVRVYQLINGLLRSLRSKTDLRSTIPNLRSKNAR